MASGGTDGTSAGTASGSTSGAGGSSPRSLPQRTVAFCVGSQQHKTTTVAFRWALAHSIHRETDRVVLLKVLEACKTVPRPPAAAVGAAAPAPASRVVLRRLEYPFPSDITWLSEALYQQLGTLPAGSVFAVELANKGGVARSISQYLKEEKAAQRAPSLLIASSSRLGGFGLRARTVRLFTGSTTARIVTLSENVPVLVVRKEVAKSAIAAKDHASYVASSLGRPGHNGGHGETSDKPAAEAAEDALRGPRTLVIAFDGNAGQCEALTRWARGAVLTPGDHVILVATAPPTPTGAAERVAEKLLQDYSWMVHVLDPQEKPSSALINFLDRFKPPPDLLIIRGALPGPSASGLPRRCLQAAACPVILVPPAHVDRGVQPAAPGPGKPVVVVKSAAAKPVAAATPAKAAVAKKTAAAEAGGEEGAGAEKPSAAAAKTAAEKEAPKMAAEEAAAAARPPPHPVAVTVATVALPTEKGKAGAEVGKAAEQTADGGEGATAEKVIPGTEVAA